jgi:hypothetical protein
LARRRLSGPISRTATGLVAALVILGAVPSAGMAQTDTGDGLTLEDELALLATSEVTLAYVVTGDPELDRTSQAGLQGLTNTLWARTSVEPAPPIGVNLETDELGFFPMLYWPVSGTGDALGRGLSPPQRLPALGRDDRFRHARRQYRRLRLRHARGPAPAPAGRTAGHSAAGADPADHVLTRTFYLLQDFPGRHVSRDVWVEAAPPDAEQIEGMPFRNLNDGVTPVLIGGNDWAAAWAVDNTGRALLPVGRGMTGERQREIALRFGVNLVMHVLSGNYKSDQVHVPGAA